VKPLLSVQIFLKTFPLKIELFRYDTGIGIDTLVTMNAAAPEGAPPRRISD
jgi:hypothetical protein